MGSPIPVKIPSLNYFAHGRPFLDRPYLVAGTALPDWLSAGDRGARLRRELLDDSELADGIRRHWADDLWFHHSAAFLEVSGTITRDLRRAHPDDPRLRAAFFGHVLTEMLLDAVLIERAPRHLDAYYEALDRIDPAIVARAARPWLRQPAPRLAATIDRFRSSRYLHGYGEDGPFLRRVGGVARRVGLPVPPRLGDVLPGARRLVRERADELSSLNRRPVG
jgi:hypothetical protein